MTTTDLLTAARAAALLGVDPSRVRQIAAQLGGTKLGRDWLLPRARVEAYRDAYRKPGPRPRFDLERLCLGDWEPHEGDFPTLERAVEYATARARAGVGGRWRALDRQGRVVWEDAHAPPQAG